MSEQLLVRLTKLIELGKCIYLYDETQGKKEASAFEKKLSSSGAKKKLIIKEEGSKEGDRQEEADVKTPFVKNGYADLKRRHQNDEN